MGLLDAADPRFHAVSPMGTGLGMLATTERLGKRVVSFALPSAPAMFLNIAKGAHKQRLAFDFDEIFVRHPSPQGTWPEDHAPLFDYFEQFSSEVFFSFAALEAFANEVIPREFTYAYKRRKKDEAVMLSKPEIERQVALEEKLTLVIPLACSCPRPNQRRMAAYKQLKEIRDRLVHLKSADRRASGPENQTLWGIMLSNRETDFSRSAVNVIAHYESLVKDRRWFSFYREERFR
jgi:hypothetical protein